MSAFIGTITITCCMRAIGSADRSCGPICICCSGCRCFRLQPRGWGRIISPRCPTALYGAVLLMAAAAYWMLQQAIIASQGPDSLLKRAVGSDWKGKLSPAVYLIGIAAAFWSPRVSQALYTAVAALWLVPDRRIENLLSPDRTRTRHKA